MQLVRLTQDFELKEFDCGDSDLNDFQELSLYQNRPICRIFRI